VKLKKPEDEKYFKDIVLNDILEEISNEVGVSTLKHTQVKRNFPTRIKKITSFILILLLIIFIVTLFIFVMEATSTKIPIAITEQVDEENWKMEVDRTILTRHTQTNTLKNSSLPKTPVSPNTIELQIPKPSQTTQTKIKTERERAKEALKEQMLH
jgi:hypothetical protein